MKDFFKKYSYTIFKLFLNQFAIALFGVGLAFATTKADPQIYVSAAEKIGQPVDAVIFVDDNVNAVKTAKTAGMISVGIFDESSAEYADEFRGFADGYVESFSELF